MHVAKQFKLWGKWPLKQVLRTKITSSNHGPAKMVTAISQQNTEQGYKIRSYAQKKKLTLKFTGAPQLREAIRKESRCVL